MEEGGMEGSLTRSGFHCNSQSFGITLELNKYSLKGHCHGGRT